MNQQLVQKTFIGIDSHRETLHCTAIDESGELIASHNFPNNEEAIIEFLKPFSPWNTFFSLEACGTWRGPYNILRRLGYDNIKLANPLKCHQIAKEKKTDKKDSEILADLNRTNYLPEVFILSNEILELRDYTRHKCKLSRFLTRIKCSIKMTLLREGVAYEDNLWSESGLNWLKNQNNEMIDDFVSVYECFEPKLKRITKKIEKIAGSKESTRLLKTIPGIGDFGATLIYAEIGDINRFPTIKDLHSYAGVVPGIYQSGSKTRSTKKKEINHWLKWILYQCTGRAITLKTKNRFRDYYYRINKRKDWRIAKKATARNFLTVIWHVLKEKQPYQES